MKKLGLLGPNGTHSEEAAIYFSKILNEEFEFEVYSDIFGILKNVEIGNLDAGFVPVENSLEGSVNITLDTLARSDNLFVTHELVWRVHNYLMAKPNIKISDVKKIYSHAQPISQCRNYLHKNFPNAEIISTPSTARAAEIVSESADNSAAICTKRAGFLNNLNLLAENIQDNMSNSTRFFEVQRNFCNDGDKVLIICQIDGSRAGSLCEVLEEFAIRKVNMTRIESRPARTDLGEYIFFFDLDNNVDRNILNESVDAVKNKCIWLKNLGTFPVLY